MQSITANIIDVHERCIFHGKITWDKGIIIAIEAVKGSSSDYVLPGFVDAHVHIESSMLVPSEFGRMAVVHGTVGTVSDPHEIANVVGEAGVRFMIDNAKKTPFKCCFGAPSCVPATAFETAGAVLDAKTVAKLLAEDDIYYLSEMMNFPGVWYKDEEVLAKIQAAKKTGKPVDGHLPGIRGALAAEYFAAGITTDHESFSYEEGLEKAKMGIKILIREGSAAKNFEALIALLPQFPNQVMFCSDDKHPNDLVAGHINQLVTRAIAKGCDLFDVLRAASVNPIEHYKLPIGQLRVGDAADFIVSNSIRDFSIKQTYIDGNLVAEHGKTLLKSQAVKGINNFNISSKTPSEFKLKAKSNKLRVIRPEDGQLVTKVSNVKAKIDTEGNVVADKKRDILKFTVVNRYHEAAPALAFIKSFGLKKGAIASCVGHDSHNILAVGVDDAALCRAVNLIIENKGGIAAVDGLGQEIILPLPIAGIISAADGWEVAETYSTIDDFVKDQLGSKLSAPFMTLSFMALTVIPALKLSDKGLFDGVAFDFVDVFR